jgi:hypothetical protein
VLCSERRDDFYTQRHAAHDAASQPDLTFNHGRFLYPAD